MNSPFEEYPSTDEWEPETESADFGPDDADQDEGDSDGDCVEEHLSDEDE